MVNDVKKIQRQYVSVLMKRIDEIRCLTRMLITAESTTSFELNPFNGFFCLFVAKKKNRRRDSLKYTIPKSSRQIVN